MITDGKILVAESYRNYLTNGNKESILLYAVGEKGSKFEVVDSEYSSSLNKTTFKNSAKFNSQDSAVKSYKNRVNKFNVESLLRECLSVGNKKLKGQL